MQQRRCEEIAAHFIPKHHSKYLMRKSMLNGKFQWLAKYTAADQTQAYGLSKLVRPQQQPASQPPAPQPPQTPLGQDPAPTESLPEQAPVRSRQPAAAHTGSLHRDNQQPRTGKSYLLSTFSSNLSRHSKARVHTQPSEALSHPKHTPRSPTLPRTCHRKVPSFFEKENRKTFSGKLNPKHPTCPTFDRARKTLELEFFALTPWALNEENADNCDFVWHS